MFEITSCIGFGGNKVQNSHWLSALLHIHVRHWLTLLSGVCKVFVALEMKHRSNLVFLLVFGLLERHNL